MTDFKTALDHFNEESFRGSFLTTGDDKLDNLLGGGIKLGTVTEISGEAGCGKSQFCMQLTANSLAKNRRIFEHCSANEDWETAKKNILFGSSATIQELQIHLQQCLSDTENIPDLLVLDSITTPFRGQDLAEEFLELDNTAVLLCKIATMKGTAVVCTNHVTSRFDEDGNHRLDPSLGAFWAHRPTSRIWMAKHDQSRWICLEKSPFADLKQSQILIRREGIRLLDI